VTDTADATPTTEAAGSTGDVARSAALDAIRAAAAARAPHGAPLPDPQVEVLATWAVLVVAAQRAGGTLFTFGNGGSAADAEHLAAELVGRYDRDRRPLAALALTTNTAAVTAIANDYGFEQVFARQVHAVAGPLDIVLGISTSGRSPNVVAGLAAARDVGARRLALLGVDGPTTSAGDVADSVLAVAPDHTPGVQEAHRLAWHLLCVGIDAILDAPLPPAAPRTGADHPVLGGGRDRAAIEQARVLDLEAALERVAGWRAAGHRIATTNGCFDVLHEGHVAALDEARRQADHLVVLCNTDASTTRVKGPGRPVVPYDQRAAVLAGLRSVDIVVALDDDLPTALLEQLRPDVHVKGSEYALGDLPEAAAVQAAGGRIHRNAMVADRSTTAFLDRIGPTS
jgi:rfaE bifunctional protein nucleotidyltransferase chain/domain